VRRVDCVGLILLAASVLCGFASALQTRTPKVDATSAADIAGDWQVAFTGAADATRVVFRISQAPAGWRAMVYWVDQANYPASVPTVTFRGDEVSFTATANKLNGSFAGTMAADHNLITGKWTQGGGANGVATQSITMVRAMKGTAWEIPSPLGSDAKIIAANLDPTFEVNTVKPHDPDVPGGGWRWIGARRFEATMSVGVLLGDIYGLQQAQIIGAPDWAFKDRYDYVGVPDLPGWPTLEQRYSMERKMIQDRFKLKVHMETREMSAMLLTTAKGGAKMAPSVMVDPGVTFSMHPATGGGGMMLTAQNSSMGDFKRTLQSFLDRPVVDKTALTGQFDFDLTFMPDDTVFGGRMHLPPVDSGAIAPDIYKAMQEQLGLKLSPFKGKVEVLVIDHIERPSSN
jgi:uncharacterized protein (TIGR03435 family)